MTDNLTSREAYEQIGPALPELCQDVLEAISKAPGGLTCYDLEQSLDLAHQTASAILTRLRRYEGLIFSTHTRRHPEKGNRRWNVYRPAYAGCRSLDKKCGDGGPNASRVTREDVVAYLAAVTDDEWDSILKEAARRSAPETAAA